MLSRGRPFMEHQRFITDVAFELDPDTGLLWYDTIVVVIMRQCGKTTIVESVLTFHLMRRPFAQLIYSAQNVDKAREKMIDEFYEQRMKPIARYLGGVKPRRSNGSANLKTLANGSTLFIVPSNETAADSKTVDAAAIDEAFSHRDLTMVGSVQPTMVTRPDPQVIITSTRGLGDDGLLLHYEDIGAAAVNDPDSRIAYFEYSAGPDDDLADPRVWAQRIPAFGITIDEPRLRSYRQSMPTIEFDRGFGNRRPTITQSAAINLEHWAHAARDDDHELPLAAPFVAGFHIHPSRSHASVAVVGSLTDDRDGADIGVLIDRRPGTGWIVEYLERLTAQGCVDIAADRGAGAGGIIDRAAGRDIAVHEITGHDVGSFCGTFVDELAEHRLAHNDQPDLNSAVNGSRTRPLGGAFAWDARRADLDTGVDASPLQAASWAVGRYRQLFPAGARLDRIA